MQSHDERNMEGLAARRDREAVVKEFSADRPAGQSADAAGAVSKIDGQEKFLSATLSIVKKSGERAADHVHLMLTAELDVDRAQKLALHTLGVL